MTTNTFTVGRDVSVVITHPYAPTGGRLDLQHVTGWNPEPQFKTDQVDRLDGRVLTQHLPKGWKGSLEIDRGNQVVDQFCQALEDAAFNNLPRVFGTVTYYIQEQDSSVSTYVLEDCAFKISGLGSFKMDDVVKQKIEVDASRRRKV